MNAEHIQAHPAPFSQGGSFNSSRTALLVIDMQRDFCAENGYMHRLGCDLARLQAHVEPLLGVLDAARSADLTIVHTREGYAPDLSDLQPMKKAGPINEAICSEDPLGRALVRGEPGWDFTNVFQPCDGEAVFDKASCGVFATTDIGQYLSK